MQVKVSVVIAAYNAAYYLKQALDSVIGQTLKEIEIILVDDHSTDSTYTIMKQYAQCDSRIHVLRHMENTAGGGAARNLGMDMAQGEYLAVLDADDIFFSDMLERTYVCAQETKADIVMFDGDIYDDQYQDRQPCNFILRHLNLPSTSVFNPRDYADKIFQMTIGPAWNLLIKRSLKEEQGLEFESLHNSNDTTFVLLVLATAKRIAILDEKLMLYRRNHLLGTSVHTTLSKWPFDVCEALWRVRQGMEKRGLYDCFRIGFVRRALEITFLYLQRKGAVWDDFVCMYQGIQREYAEKMDFWSISNADIGTELIVAQRCLLKSCGPESFAACILQSGQLSCEAQNIPQGASVAIYGAGDKGADFFHQVYRRHKWKIVCWADRDYAKLGWPVVSPESIVEYKPKYVLIAIENRQVCTAVKRELVRRGLEEAYIWPALSSEKSVML